MKPTLTILTGELAGEKIQLEAGRTIIFGRDQTADYTLAEKKVSRRHAALTWDTKEQRVILEDLRSLNGTYVNGNQIHNPVDINHLDRFQVGSFLFEMNFPTPRTSSRKEIVQNHEPRSTDPRGVNPSLLDFDPQLQTDGASISGNLREVSLPDLLQLLSSSRKSGMLVIVQKKKDLSRTPPRGSAVLYLQEGQLIAAEHKDLRNDEAFYEILKWVTGYFSLYHIDGSVEKKMWLPLEALLLEGARRMDEERTQNIEFFAEDTFDVKLDEPLTSLEAEQLRIFQIIWKKKKMAEIWKSSHLDEKTTNSIVRQLIRMGFVKKL